MANTPVQCVCKGEVFVPAEENYVETIDPDLNNPDYLLTIPGLQQLLAHCLVELMADKKSSPARKADIAAKVCGAIVRLGAEIREDERIARLEKMISELEGTTK